MKINLDDIRVEAVKEVEGHDGCYGCMFNSTSYKTNNGLKCWASTVINKVFGINCGVESVIFVEKEKWVDCTPENIKVGATVKGSIYGKKYKVSYVFNTREKFCAISLDSDEKEIAFRCDSCYILSE